MEHLEHFIGTPRAMKRLKGALSKRNRQREGPKEWERRR